MASPIKPDSNTLGILSQSPHTSSISSKSLDIGKNLPDGNRSNAQGRTTSTPLTGFEDRVAGGLSSASELQAAKRRAVEFTTTNDARSNVKESPFGRISATVNAKGQRDIPLGQIVDIRV